MRQTRSVVILIFSWLFLWNSAYADSHNPLMTPWAADLDTDRVLPQYPRPQMSREEWMNLNGFWNYAIRSTAETMLKNFDGKILVPFAIESALSQVRKSVDTEHYLWYQRSFQLPASWQAKRIRLHFGAVDWYAKVWVNGQLVGEHKGGFTPFSFDVTNALGPGADQTLTVRVWDPTDKGQQPLGKQTLKPGGIWYTSVTGIWQTVWLEPVPASEIEELNIVPDIDSQSIQVHVQGRQLEATTVTISAFDQGRLLASSSGPYQAAPYTLSIPNPQLWSPAKPHLYDLRVSVSADDQEKDVVQSYFAMRKVQIGADAQGTTRILLNNQPLFQYGLLDQGWWPDGLYTAPTEQALLSDLSFAKQAGFNMLRKHVKVEPARWYYHCDRLGILVWQDMPSSRENSKTSAPQFEAELEELVDALESFPSIIMWVLFNEGWGQYDTQRLTQKLRGLDSSRLINSASGWVDYKVGDINDIHRYPGPARPEFEASRAAVLGEFGGLGLPIKGHLWKDQDNWGYETYKTKAALKQAYAGLIQDLRRLVREGLSAAVYTQLTDVEVEVNGWLTYDRREQKAASTELFDLHRELYAE